MQSIFTCWYDYRSQHSPMVLYFEWGLHNRGVENHDMVYIEYNSHVYMLKTYFCLYHSEIIPGTDS